MKYLPLLILALPTLSVCLLWNFLPEQMPVHVWNVSVDRYGNREDFAALVMVVTLIFGLMCYITVRAISSFNLMSQKELDKADQGGAIGAAVIGFMMLGAGWFGAV